MYTIEIDNVCRNDWAEILLQFDDANIYQTWELGAIRWGENNLSHIILRKNKNILAAAQVHVKTIPMFRAGIAGIKWGPIWRRKKFVNSIDDYNRIIQEIRNEYVINRGLLLRVTPREILEKDSENILDIFSMYSYYRNANHSSYKSLQLNIEESIELIRQNFLQKWRNCLNKAEKSNLKVYASNSDDYFGIFMDLVKQMISRKGFTPQVNYDEFRVLQKMLPENLKMKIFVCFHNEIPICVSICSAIGDTGIYLLGATGNEFKKMNGSYLLQIKMIEWLKEIGCKWYDLGGIDPVGNPGVYEFKTGIAGKRGKYFELIGMFSSYDKRYMVINRYIDKIIGLYRK